MEDHDQGRSGLKEQNKSLSLNRKSREVSLERQTSARESQVADLRSVETATKAKPTEGTADVKLDSAFASILKKKVYVLVDTENAVSQTHRRIKHLEEQLQQKTVPKGLKIKPVKAKSKSEDLQKKFDNILHEVELKLLDVTLEGLCKEVFNTRLITDLCFLSRTKNPLEKLTYWPNTPIFYFQCTANKTSKALIDALNKEEKAKTQIGMETEFTLTEESVRDIVQAEVQRLSSQKGSQKSRGRSGRKGTQSSNNVNNSQHRGRSSSKGKNNRKRSQNTGRKPKRRGQSSSNNRRVSLPKNGGGRGTGHGT